MTPPIAWEPVRLDAALAYARRGIGVFPLRPRTKIPATRNGLHDATRDLDVIAQWWQPANPQWNIAIRPTDDLIVLDVDPRSGGSMDDLGHYPTTRTAATGGGGWHVWFRYSGPVRGKLGDAQGVDIKSRSGYLVAPPSIHPSGQRYRWMIEHPAAPLPAHLIERVAPPPVCKPFRHSGSSTTDGLVRTVADATEGNRNHALFWAACRAVDDGADPAVFADLLHAATSVGLSEREAHCTINSAIRRAS